jgi:hypothetical protein
MLSETVNPANGSVSLRIQVPIPKGRGITIPFSFSYDSNGVNHLAPTSPGHAAWQSNTGYLSQGGWAYSVPMASVANSVVTAGNSPNTYNCNTWSNYMFVDPSGGQHALRLATQYSSTQGACPWGGLSIQSSGDAQVEGQLPQVHPDPDNPSATTFEPVNVLTGDGTVYTFPSLAHGVATSNIYVGLPSLIEDRNGNQITVTDNNNGIFAFTDTAGRTIISSNGFGPSGATNSLSFSNLNYQVTWGPTTPAVTSFSPSSSWVGDSAGPTDPTDECITGIPAVSTSQTVIAKITLPNGQAYQFHYGTDNSLPQFQNSFGLLNEIDYPSGAWIKYQWAITGLNELADYPGALPVACNDGPCYDPVPDGCLYQYGTPVVVTREVGFGGSAPSLTQSFVYQTNWGGSAPPAALTWTTKVTSVTTTDNVLNKAAVTKYTYGSTVAPKDPFDFSTLVQQIPVENTIQYSDYTGSVLRTVNKLWWDQYDLKSEQTVLDNGQSATTTYCYALTVCTPAPVLSQLIEQDDSDYTGTVLRKTLTTFQTFSSALPNHGTITNAPSSVVIENGGGTHVAETDYLYDGGSTGTAAAIQHDTNYPSGSGLPRGNPTTKTQQCFAGSTNCQNAVTTYSYDETGQVISVKDACGNGTCSDMSTMASIPHTTTYLYADSYSSGTPPGGTNAYVTTITDALGHSSAFTYGYSDGQLTSSTDPNLQVTNYKYNTPPSGCSLPDNLDRLSESDYPDGGKTTYCYNDSPYNPSTPSPSVTTTTEMSSGNSKATTAAFDGIGHTVETILNTTPNLTYTNTSYDGIGQPYKVYNPYYGSSDPTYGFTSYVYDGLGRTCLIVPPDVTSVPSTCPTSAPAGDVFTSYSGNCSTVTDEAGKSRKSCSDALGRMTGVWEDPASLNYETDYTYDALDDLLTVNQKGDNSAPRMRSFAYDSLSRLLSAANPESGTIYYAYDANSNVITKTAPKPNQIGTATVVTTSTYDQLNRVLSKSYNDTITPPEFFYYDAAPPHFFTCSNCWTNPVGRLMETVTGTGP